MNKKQLVGTQKRFLALMQQHGAQPIVEGWHLDTYDAKHFAHVLTRKRCALEIRLHANNERGSTAWVSARWRNPIEDVKAAGLPFHNPYSGKWNHHGFGDHDAVESLAQGLGSHNMRIDA